MQFYKQGKVKARDLGLLELFRMLDGSALFRSSFFNQAEGGGQVGRVPCTEDACILFRKSYVLAAPMPRFACVEVAARPGRASPHGVLLFCKIGVSFFAV